jgi:hypothetical protein
MTRAVLTALLIAGTVAAVSLLLDEFSERDSNSSTIDMAPDAFPSKAAITIDPARRDMTISVVRQHAEPAPEKSQADYPTSAGPPPAQLIDSSAIGRPFPLSPSVLRRCRWNGNERNGCPDLLDFLDRFSEEPRDLLWAQRMEEGLETFVERTAPSFSVRSIEWP